MDWMGLIGKMFAEKGCLTSSSAVQCGLPFASDAVRTPFRGARSSSFHGQREEGSEVLYCDRLGDGLEVGNEVGNENFPNEKGATVSTVTPCFS